VTAPSKEGAALRAEVEMAVLAGAKDPGAERIDAAGIVRQFSQAGALYACPGRHPIQSTAESKIPGTPRLIANALLRDNRMWTVEMA
jgi:hypothetical protein